MDFKTIDYEVRDHVAHMRFTRGEAANVVNRAFAADLRAVMLEIEWDDDVRAVSVTADGKLFSAGGDLKENRRIRRETPPQLHRLLRQPQNLD